MTNIILTTSATLKSNGRTSCWFTSEEEDLYKLENLFLEKFPEIKSISNISLMSLEKGKDNLPLKFGYWRKNKKGKWE